MDRKGGGWTCMKTDADLLFFFDFSLPCVIPEAGDGSTWSLEFAEAKNGYVPTLGFRGDHCCETVNITTSTIKT